MLKFLFGIAFGGLMMSRVATAADVVPAPTLHDWSGFYLGGQIGADFYNAGDKGTSNLQSSTGIMGGLNAEFLKQSNHVVFGLVGDGNLSTNSGTAFCFTGPTGCTLSSSWNASLRGKLGFATNKVLFYGTGGWGWADFHKTSTSGNNDFRTLNGWAAGGGISYALSPKWSANLEYIHYDLGSGTPINVIGLEVAAPSMDTITIGASFKF